MGFFLPQRPVLGNMVTNLGAFSGWSIRRKMLVTVIPLIIIVLVSTGIAARWVSGRYLTLALERISKVLTMGQADAVSDILEEARQDILLLSRGRRDEQTIRAFMELKSSERPGLYREAAFYPSGVDGHVLIVNSGKELVSLGKEQGSLIMNSPLLAPSKVLEPKSGFVVLQNIAETSYAPGILPEAQAGATFTILRLVTPVADQHGRLTGFWVLSVNAAALRDVLSLYNSAKSPLAAFPRTLVKRYSFFFDTQGWMLFQSGNLEERDAGLSTDLARSGLSGDHGMPGFPGAFRPAALNEAYWRMVVDIQAGRAGIEAVGADFDSSSTLHDTYSLGYAPVYFKGGPDRQPEVVGGVAFMDKSLLLLAAEYRLFDVLLVIFVVAIGLTVFLVYILSRLITRPMKLLTDAVRAMPEEGSLRPIDLPDGDQETLTLKESINHLIRSVLAHREELRLKEASLQDHLRRQPLDLGRNNTALQDEQPIEGIIGVSPAMRELKWHILKAASVDADVLIIGETGTGKEVTAQAIHRISRRVGGPFISINCGALDENLLMDALFGHVKGAFSEAKTNRKGAFLAAHGGTILLDEIGNASAKVQQALLRTLAARTVIPLGSDQEIPFDARVIAATNVDLRDCAERGLFREDLYYRLRVISLHTPPLSERPTDFPLLVDAFLKESAKIMHKADMQLSRGAWERIAAHNWPGNVRELKHCIMRAVAMADSTTIYVEDLRFEEQAAGADRPPRAEAAKAPGTPFENAPWQNPQARQAGEEAFWDSRGTVSRNGLEPSSLAAPAAASAGDAHDVQDWAPVQNEASRKKDVKPQDVPDADINERQSKGLRFLQEHGAMSRAQYQAILGAGTHARTAQYDLRDLVERGLLAIQGRGPATRYVLVDKDR